MPAPRCMRFPPRTGSDRGPSHQRARSSVAWRELSCQRKRLTACLRDLRYVRTILALGAQSETPLTVTLPARASTTFQSTRAGHDDLRSVLLLAEDRDLGSRLAALDATAGDDSPRNEGLVRPQYVGELHVQAPAQVQATAEMPGQELGDARERHAAPDHRVSEPELLRGGLVVVVVPAAVAELVAHRFGECLAELDRQRLPGELAPLPRAFLARRIAEGDPAAGLLRQEALVMDAARDQAPGLVSHPHLLRDDVAIAPPVAIGHPRAELQDLSHARRRMDLPFLTPPQVAEEVVEVPALELAVRLLVDDQRSHRSAKGRRRRIPGVWLAEPLDVVLDHLVGDGQLERAEILARVHVRRHHERDPPGHAPAAASASCPQRWATRTTATRSRARAAVTARMNRLTSRADPVTPRGFGQASASTRKGGGAPRRAGRRQRRPPRARLASARIF